MLVNDPIDKMTLKLEAQRPTIDYEVTFYRLHARLLDPKERKKLKVGFELMSQFVEEEDGSGQDFSAMLPRFVSRRRS